MRLGANRALLHGLHGRVVVVRILREESLFLAFIEWLLLCSEWFLFLDEGYGQSWDDGTGNCGGGGAGWLVTSHGWSVSPGALSLEIKTTKDRVRLGGRSITE